MEVLYPFESINRKMASLKNSALTKLKPNWFKAANPNGPVSLQDHLNEKETESSSGLKNESKLGEASTTCSIGTIVEGAQGVVSNEICYGLVTTSKPQGIFRSLTQALTCLNTVSPLPFPQFSRIIIFERDKDIFCKRGEVQDEMRDEAASCREP